jgi:hypothetical protein
MAHNLTFLDCKTNPVTGVAELVYEFDGHIDSMAFDSLAAIADAAESGDVMQTGTQALMVAMAFWSAREDFDRNISKMMGQQVEIDFHAPVQVPQVRFAPP